ncbi:MAG: heavy metal-associated domain-containing protein [Halofilum sp. (in: g-proteobacteria)]|nr:heavy metal-associated domain-containing protein [Halofilum sp. (in: g-proteobacteria)]
MKTVLRSDELNCPSCVPKIEKALDRLEGVNTATVHFNTGRIEVEHDDALAVERLRTAIHDVGYEAYVSAF